MNYYEMPIWRQFLLTCEDNLLGSLILLIYLYPIFNEASIRHHLKKFLPLLPLPVAIAAVNWGMAGIVQNTPLLYILCTLSVLVFTFWSMSVWQCSFLQGLSGACIAEVLENAMCIIFKHLLYIVFPLEGLETANPDLLLLIMWLTLPAHLAVSLALKHLKLGEKLRILLEDANGIRRTAILFMALEFIFVVLNHLQYDVEKGELAEYLIIVAALTLFAVVLVFHLAQRDVDKRQLQIQQDVIVKQQIYEQNLGNLRQEMKLFWHDYKSVLAGFAGNAEENDSNSSLQKLEAGIGWRLGEKMQAYTQIDNLRIPQIRSLLLGKMTAMSEQGIECRLEVLYPVERIEMDTWDFARCLGILADNAMEAALETAHPWVEFIFLQTETIFTLRVSNPWEGEVNRAGIWEKGWSTKGKGRGLGLFRYQNILQKYPRVSYAASWGNGIFVQELTMGEEL